MKNVFDILNLPHYIMVIQVFTFKNCKVTGNPTLLITLFFCLKVGMSKKKNDLDL